MSMYAKAVYAALYIEDKYCLKMFRIQKICWGTSTLHTCYDAKTKIRKRSQLLKMEVIIKLKICSKTLYLDHEIITYEEKLKYE